MYTTTTMSFAKKDLLPKNILAVVILLSIYGCTVLYELYLQCTWAPDNKWVQTFLCLFTIESSVQKCLQLNNSILFPCGMCAHTVSLYIYSLAATTGTAVDHTKS